jgi:hypothetical protein
MRRSTIARGVGDQEAKAQARQRPLPAFFLKHCPFFSVVRGLKRGIALIPAPNKTNEYVEKIL